MNEQSWSTMNMENDLVNLEVVPDIGGRILQYSLGDYGFFIVNKDLYGKQPPESGVGPDDTWLDYGGDKMWLAPQGWDNDQQWPGPPDPVLDGQPFALDVISDNKIHLTSRKDMRSGVQLSRFIEVFDGSTRVSIDATMKNIDNKPRRWGIWAHTQFDASDRHGGKEYNENYSAYCPLNPNSVFVKGYGVQYGLVNNMSYQPDYEKNMMRVQYLRRVGKIGIDSTAGWVATVDGTDGYVFVHRFDYEHGKEYPDNSSVEIWMSGLGQFVAWGKVNDMLEDVLCNFESEVISPYANLQPGEEYTYHYEWYSAKIPVGLGVVDCTDVGVVCEALSAKLDSSLNITGKFGVFYEGSLKISALNKNGKEIEVLASDIKVSPLEAVEINLKVSRQSVSSKTKAVSISLLDKNGNLVGELAKAEL